jgi:hypothetical protein
VNLQRKAGNLGLGKELAFMAARLEPSAFDAALHRLLNEAEFANLAEGGDGSSVHAFPVKASNRQVPHGLGTVNADS